MPPSQTIPTSSGLGAALAVFHLASGCAARAQGPHLHDDDVVRLQRPPPLLQEVETVADMWGICDKL